MENLLNNEDDNKNKSGKHLDSEGNEDHHAIVNLLGTAGKHASDATGSQKGSSSSEH